MKRGIELVNDKLIEMLESRAFFKLSAQFTGPLMKGWLDFVREVESDGILSAVRSAATKIIVFMGSVAHDILILFRRHLLGPLMHDVATWLESIQLKLIPGFKPAPIVPKGELTAAAINYWGNAQVDPLTQPFRNTFPEVTPTRVFRGSLYAERYQVGERHGVRTSGRFHGDPTSSTLPVGQSERVRVKNGRLMVEVTDTGDEKEDLKRAKEIGTEVAKALAKYLNKAQ